MATKLLSRGSRGAVVAYMPSFRGLVQHLSRGFSSYDEWTQENSEHTLESNILDDITEPDLRLGPLSPKDSRFPLPGLVGSVSKTQPANIPSAAPIAQPDILTTPTAAERQVLMVQQYLNAQDMIVDDSEAEDFFFSEGPLSALDSLECQATDCPKLLKRDFQELFPGHHFGKQPLTVVTVCQKTENDMTVWNTEVEEERETLLQLFITGASEICKALQKAGYWADFIEPASGRPYLSEEFTNATMFETDERYRHFGFEINDLGCCKVISHHLWGTHAFVGCLFTNAPVNHPVLTEMINKKDWEEEH